MKTGHSRTSDAVLYADFIYNVYIFSKKDLIVSLMEVPVFGIYIHIPFCIRKCPYCDFYSVSVSKGLRQTYLSALKNQILSFDPVKADTIYFGGGTPSLLMPEEISEILDVIKSKNDISADAEISMECNPATVTKNSLRDFLSAGINRLSVGCQSFHGPCLEALGRLHSVQEAVQTVNDAYDAGFRNVSADIMLGIPFEDPQIAAEDASTAASLGLQHVSAYLLRICEGTPFADGVAGVPEDDVQAECYRAFCSVMDSCGYTQYEISNFARPGYESRHNLKYWQCASWLGLGPAAHSSIGGKRYSFPADLRNYISVFGSGPASDPLACLKEEGTVDAEEYIITSLRTSNGLDLQTLSDRFGSSFGEPELSFLRECEKAGLAEISPGRIRLTRDGFLVSNSIISELL